MKIAMGETDCERDGRYKYLFLPHREYRGTSDNFPELQFPKEKGEIIKLRTIHGRTQTKPRGIAVSHESAQRD